MDSMIESNEIPTIVEANKAGKWHLVHVPALNNLVVNRSFPKLNDARKFVKDNPGMEILYLFKGRKIEFTLKKSLVL